MRMTFHGGKCCGMKHIYGLGADPEAKTGAKENTKPLTYHAQWPDRTGNEVTSSYDVMYDAAPKETHLERLERLLAFIDAHQPHCIVEIVLCDFACYNSSLPTNIYNQLPKWRPVIEERGFVEVNNCFNSNSNNRVYVFHRKTDKA